MTGLNYQIDIQYVVSPEAFIGDDAGSYPDAMGNTRARFRDPATAAALAAAPDWVQAVFRQAGFGFEPSGCDTAPETVTEAEHLLRMQKLHILMTELKTYGASHARVDGGLDMAALFAHEAELQLTVARQRPGTPPHGSEAPTGPGLAPRGDWMIWGVAALAMLGVPFIASHLASHFDNGLNVSNIRIMTLSVDD